MTASGAAELRAALEGRNAEIRARFDAGAPARMWPADRFFHAKEREQRERHLRHRDSAYHLEPNVKEGPGGLRDIQTIAWVARRCFGAQGGTSPGLRDLFVHGFLTEEEFRSLRDGQDFLWQARTALHYLAGRREDRLLFDRQIAIADHFGYRDADHNLGVEQFMKRYYRTVHSLGRLNELLLQLFRERFLDRQGRSGVRPLNRRFQVRDGQIEVVDDGVFRRHPFALLEVFLLLQQHPELGGVRASTIRHIRRHLHLVDEEFRRDLACRSRSSSTSPASSTTSPRDAARITPRTVSAMPPHSASGTGSAGSMRDSSDGSCDTTSRCR